MAANTEEAMQRNIANESGAFGEGEGRKAEGSVGEGTLWCVARVDGGLGVDLDPLRKFEK